MVRVRRLISGISFRRVHILLREVMPRRMSWVWREHLFGDGWGWRFNVVEFRVSPLFALRIYPDLLWFPAWLRFKGYGHGIIQLSFGLLQCWW